MKRLLILVAMMMCSGAWAASYPATYNVMWGSGAAGGPCNQNVDLPGWCNSYSSDLATACKGIVPFAEVDESLPGRDPGNSPFTATSSITATGVTCTLYTRSGTVVPNLPHAGQSAIAITCGAPQSSTLGQGNPPSNSTFTAFVGYSCTGSGADPGTGTAPVNPGQAAPDCRYWVFSCYFKSPRSSLETSTIVAGATGSFTDNTYTFVAPSASVYLEADGMYQDGSDGTNITGISTSPSLGSASCSNNSCSISTGTATAGTTYTVTITGNTTGTVNSHAYLLQVPYTSWTAWTPTLTFGGNSTGITYSSQEGQYSIDSSGKVHITGYVGLSSKGTSTGVANIPLPVPANTGSLLSQCALVEAGAITHSGVSTLSNQVYNGAFTFIGIGSNGDYVLTLSNSDFANNSWFSFTCDYY